MELPCVIIVYRTSEKQFVFVVPLLLQQCSAKYLPRKSYPSAVRIAIIISLDGLDDYGSTVVRFRSCSQAKQTRSIICITYYNYYYFVIVVV